MAMQFNGSSDYLRGGPFFTEAPFQYPISRKQQNVSFATWIYVASFGGTNSGPLYNGSAGSNGWGLRTNIGGTGTIGIDTSGTGGGVMTGTFTLSTSTWYHLCATNDGSIWTLYLNAVADTLSSNNKTGDIATGTTVIGATFTGSDFFGAGKLADLAIWEACLTQREVYALFRGERPDNVRSNILKAYWSFDGRGHPTLEEKSHFLTRVFSAPVPAADPPLLAQRSIPVLRPGLLKSGVTPAAIYAFSQMSANFSRRITTIGY